MPGILSSYRILDLGRFISGPFCASLLADMGAEVIRVEPTQGSDDRYVMPIGENGLGGGALHYQVNHGKDSLAIDITNPDARPVLEVLIGSADVVIANMPVSALKKLGLDYETLRAIKPDIVLTTINAYGPDGPYANAIGFDGTGQALSGAMALTGTPDQPFRSAVSYVDYSTAISAALGTVTALLNRERTGAGEHVQCSLLGTALAMTNPMLIEEASGARHRVATGNRSPIAGPSDLFRTKDGWVMIQVIGQAMFQRWAYLMGSPELTDEPRFKDDQSRGENGNELSNITASWAASKTTEECLELLRAHRLPATPMLTSAEVLEAPEVVVGNLLEYTKTQSSQVPVMGSLCRFSQHRSSGKKTAPQLGEHTRSIMRGIGYDDASITEMHLRGVVADATNDNF